jgi:uncharacterized protein
VPEINSIQHILLPLMIGAVAFLYSSVGHGGATGYLAVAALLSFAPAVMRPGALWMNCIVAGIAFYRFRSSGFFDGKVFWPLAVASIPFAWLGSQLHLEGRGYGYVLGFSLLLAGWFLGWGRREQADNPTISFNWPIALSTGAGLGFLAGLTGVGGGVFLTPLLIFFKWTPAKLAGGVSALFIVVNSVAGLTGLGERALIWQPAMVWAVALGASGALLGSYMGVSRWQVAGFRRALGVVLWIAAGKLVITGS